MTWILLSLVAPLFWAGSTFVDKYLLSKHTKGIYDFLFFSTLTNWVFTLGLILFFGLPRLNTYSLIPLATGIVLLYSYGFYGKALEKEEASSLVVLFKLIPVISLLLGFLFLGQTLSFRELIGFIVVLLGTIAISFERVDKHLVPLKGLGLILVSIIIWAMLFVLMDFGLSKMPYWDFFTIHIFGGAIAGPLLMIVPDIRKQIITGFRYSSRRKFGFFFMNDLLGFMGEMTATKALALGPSVALVTVLIQIQSFYAIIIGAILTLLVPSIIKENISWQALTKKLIGAAIMFGGIYLMLL